MLAIGENALTVVRDGMEFAYAEGVSNTPLYHWRCLTRPQWGQ
jgi:hypothetical protein